MSTAHSLLEVRELSVRYARRRGDRRAPADAVNGIDLTIDQGATYGLVGESGCGKSTTARAIMGLVPRTAGTIRLGGQDLDTAGKQGNRTRRIQMVFQDPYSSLNPRRRVGSILQEALTIAGAPRSGRRDKVLAILDRVGLSPDHADRFPGDFSGGQRQRIGLARALVVDPELVICDEPVSALDVSVQAQVLNLMRGLQVDLGVSFLFITHDLSVVRYIADRVGVMRHGAIVEEADTNNLFTAPKHPYTSTLLNSIPSITFAQSDTKKGPQ